MRLLWTRFCWVVELYVLQVVLGCFLFRVCELLGLFYLIAIESCWLLLLLFDFFWLYMLWIGSDLCDVVVYMFDLWA